MGMTGLSLRLMAGWHQVIDQRRGGSLQALGMLKAPHARPYQILGDIGIEGQQCLA